MIKLMKTAQVAGDNELGVEKRGEATAKKRGTASRVKRLGGRWGGKGTKRVKTNKTREGPEGKVKCRNECFTW